jgi:dimethylamine corrinoid protein
MKPRPGLDPASLTGRVAALDEQGALEAVQVRVAAGDDALAIIADCQRGMQFVGEDYAAGEYYIGGLIMAGEIFREAMEILEPMLPAHGSVAEETPGGSDEAAGSVLLCTVRGDIHDIGKSIVVTLLRSHGLTVHDLGVDVAPAEVAGRALELRPDVVGLSGLLTVAHQSMKDTVAEVRRAAPRLGRPLPVIIGGGAVDAEVCAWTGADVWAADAVRGVQLIREAVAAGR